MEGSTRPHRPHTQQRPRAAAAAARTQSTSPLKITSNTLQAVLWRTAQLSACIKHLGYLHHTPWPSAEPTTKVAPPLSPATHPRRHVALAQAPSRPFSLRCSLNSSEPRPPPAAPPPAGTPAARRALPRTELRTRGKVPTAFQVESQTGGQRHGCASTTLSGCVYWGRDQVAAPEVPH